MTTMNEVEFQVRKASKKDCSELVNFYRITKTLTKEDVAIICNLFSEVLARKTSIVLIAVNYKSEILGYLAGHFIPFPMKQLRELYISDLIVLNTQRGKGIGTQLVKAAEKFAIKNKCKRIMLNNSKTSESYNRNFYKKLGFTERKRFSNFIKLLD